MNDAERPSRFRWRLRTNTLLLLVALFIALTQNRSFWHQVLTHLPAQRGPGEYLLLGSLFIVLNTLLLLVMALLSPRRLVKPVLIVLVLLASACSYFMDSFGTVIDASMITNLVQTDPREAGELIGLPLILHLLLTGLLPALLISRVELESAATPLREFGRRSLLVALALTLTLGAVFSSYKTVSLWARENRAVRTYVNPTYPIYALFRHIRHEAHAADAPPRPIATDAVRAPSADGRPRVVVLVVGETARAENFQLDGYARATNPELAATAGLVSFDQTWSCGTATAESVPCMFSRLGRDNFSRGKAAREENLLDVLQRTGIAVLWRDNNSDCKGVCARVPNEDLRRRKVAGICHDGGCYDDILLQGLDELVGKPGGDRLIVLHALGSHGPSYYRRYPPEFRRFTPDCARDDVQTCSRESIVNAYDNTILYSDHVLAELIHLLDRHRDAVDPTMIYLSDHGESLGEDGLYLHGLPYPIAPDLQKHVPFLLWSPQIDSACAGARRSSRLSHDNLFDTVLGLFSVQTSAYRAAQDVLAGCMRAPERAQPTTASSPHQSGSSRRTDARA